INGALHPRFRKGSDSRKVRNGVGIRDGGRTAVFALSQRPVNFWDFASLFRDHLGTDNALYLDGTISSIHAPSLNRSDFLFPVGPIIAVVE
ncbi:MAG: phosphodiester glycosidase family protein, partial [Pseudomonadota bacterium]